MSSHVPERIRIGEAVDLIARNIASQLDLETLARRVSEAVQTGVDAAAASVLLLEENHLRFLGATGPAADSLQGAVVSRDGGVAGEVVRTGRAILVKEARQHPSTEELNAAAGFVVHTLVAAPLVVNDRILGVVEAVNRAHSTDPFGPEHLAFLERLAPHVAAAVSNAILTQELRRSRDELATQNLLLEEKIAERTRLLANAKDEWELTFDSIGQPLAILRDGVIRRTNRAYATIAERDIRQIPGMRCHEALFHRDAPCPGCRLLAGEPPDQEDLEVVLPQGTFVRRVFRVGDASRPDDWVVSYTDVTEERRLAAQLREAEHLGAVARLAAGAAHEINNPMAFLTAALRTLRSYTRDLGKVAELGAEAARATDPAVRNAKLAELATHAEAIDLPALVDDVRTVIGEGEEGARRITAIVAALRILGPDERGRREPSDLSVILDRAMDRLLRLLPFDGEIVWRRREPALVQGSPLQLEQALFELVRNAAQATPPGGSIELSAYVEGDRAVVEIADAGPGVSAEIRPYVFEPFFTTRGVGGGIGLGLAIAYGVTRRHEGTISLENRESGGALARLTLPFDRGGILSSRPFDRAD